MLPQRDAAGLVKVPVKPETVRLLMELGVQHVMIRHEKLCITHHMYTGTTQHNDHNTNDVQPYTAHVMFY
jgi:hypothetical protein